MSKRLVAYFSASGVTERIAKRVASLSNADVFEIEPETRYTAADLDWTNKKSRSTLEMTDETSRPKIKGTVPSFEDYDVIFIGFPNWWGVEPRIIDSFLESYDFSSKTVIPFFTSGGSGKGKIEERISKLCPSSDVRGTMRLTSAMSDAEIKSWLNNLCL